MGRNNADFYGGTTPNADDVVSAAKAGYITKEQAGDLHPKVKRFLKSKGEAGKDSDADVDRVNKKVDNITYGGPPGKTWRTG